MQYIHINRVSKKYGTIPAVDNIDLGINKGEIYGLLGPNGAGKSTTISMVTSLIKPDKGEIIVAGMNIRTQHKDIKKNNRLCSPGDCPLPDTHRKRKFIFLGGDVWIQGQTITSQGE